MLARALRLSLSLALLGSAACGGSMAEISREERDREDSALLARGYHDDLVRLVGDPEGGPIAPDQCSAACGRSGRVQQLASRICDVAASDDHDEATQFLCEDARTREQGLAQRLAACTCE